MEEMDRKIQEYRNEIKLLLKKKKILLKQNNKNKIDKSNVKYNILKKTKKENENDDISILSLLSNEKETNIKYDQINNKKRENDTPKMETIDSFTQIISYEE